MKLTVDLHSHSGYAGGVGQIELPTVSIRTPYEGAIPEVMERLITQIIEEIVATVPGVEEISSESSEGRSNVREVLYGEQKLIRQHWISRQDLKMRLMNCQKILSDLGSESLMLIVFR